MEVVVAVIGALVVATISLELVGVTEVTT